MNLYAKMIRTLKTPAIMARLNDLYGAHNGVLVTQTTRLTCLLKRHEELYGTDGPVWIVSAPGRTEIGGNHTDHNNGKVLAAAVNLDFAAAVSPRADGVVRMRSEGFPDIEMNLSELSPVPAEKNTTAALVRGVAARMKELGYAIGGFDAVMSATVLPGSGLSSSAAVEVMICAIFDVLYSGFTIDAKVRAQICQFAENTYFGKPSGLMDQMASSVGGLVFIDFKEKEARVREVHYDFAKKGYALVTVNTRGNHGDLTADYATIPAEMHAVADCFGEKNLRRVRQDQFMRAIAQVREKAGDRAVLRAMHYFEENKRVTAEVEALQKDDLDAFFAAVIASGRSSFMYLQNVYSHAGQELAVALALAESLLAGKGAWRVHGGGFAGTTLNFVPLSDIPAFTEAMEAVFGEHSCQTLFIRQEGPAALRLWGEKAE